jgi:hypothetical protein
MSAVTIAVDDKRLIEFLEAAPQRTSLGVLRALKRGTAAAKTHAGRVVAKDMGLKVSDVKNAIRVVEPTAQTLTGELRADLKRIPLIKFGATGPRPSRGKGKGVTYKAQGGKKRLPSGFIARLSGGHEGVFKRVGHPRTPITQLFGPSIGRVFGAHAQEIMARGQEQFDAELAHQLDRITGGN